MSLDGAAQAVLEAVQRATGLSGKVVVGEGALDGCCEDDGWAMMVTVEGFAPVDGFPASWGPGPDGNVKCGPQIAVQMHVVVSRCVPVMDDRGRPPSAEAEQEAHMELMNVAGKAWKSVARLSPDMIVGTASPFTVEGGCGYIDIPVLVDGDEWC